MENNVKYVIPLVNEDTLTTISGSDIDCAKACRKKILMNEDGGRVGCTHWSVTKEPANGEKKCYLAFPSFSAKPHEDFISGSVDCAEGNQRVFQYSDCQCTVGAIKTSAPRIVPGLTRYDVPSLPWAVQYIVPGQTRYNVPALPRSARETNQRPGNL